MAARQNIIKVVPGGVRSDPPVSASFCPLPCIWFRHASVDSAALRNAHHLAVAETTGIHDTAAKIHAAPHLGCFCALSSQNQEPRHTFLRFSPLKKFKSEGVPWDSDWIECVVNGRDDRASLASGGSHRSSPDLGRDGHAGDAWCDYRSFHCSCSNYLDSDEPHTVATHCCVAG